MQPNATVDQDTLAVIWQTFTQTGKITRYQKNLLDPTVLLSWQRCMPRLNPLATPRSSPVRGQLLSPLLRAQSDLITIATPLIEDIYQLILGSGCSIILTDSSACNLYMAGDVEAKALIESHNLGLGSYWSEGQIGTNAAGVALVNAMPAYIVGAEHYFSVFHQLFSSASPIHNLHGRILGTICVCGPIEAANSFTPALAMSAAMAISNQIHADWSLDESNHRLGEVNAVLSAISEGVLAWNFKGEIHHVNAKASSMLGLNPFTIVGHKIDEVIELPELVSKAIANDEELRNREVSFQINGRSIRSLISLRAIKHAADQPVGYIAMLRPIEQVRQLVQQQAGTHASLTIDDVYGQTPGMRRVVNQSRIAARGTAPVLLRGEGGVGKNHLAQAIHNDGERASKPFLAINCRAIPHELMISELLGEDESDHIRPSKFELADGGTLFLDQVDSLSLEMQAAVLQVFETGHVLHLGGKQPIPVDVRIIVSTSEDLEQLVGEGSFLPHLYYRFGVFNIYIPPLRQRTEDIPLLAERFLARITRRDARAMWIDDTAMEALKRYPWPGNVRELESVLERAAYQSREGIIRLTNLPEMTRQRRVITDRTQQAQQVLSVMEAEQEAIIRAGWACQGRVSEMARQLQIGRTTLWRKMKRYNISPEQFKQRS
jgi:transcriptional activator for dhaKLM operon